LCSKQRDGIEIASPAPNTKAGYRPDSSNKYCIKCPYLCESCNSNGACTKCFDYAGSDLGECDCIKGITLRVIDALLAQIYAKFVDLENVRLLKKMQLAKKMELYVNAHLAITQRDRPCSANLAQLFANHALTLDVIRMGVSLTLHCKTQYVNAMTISTTIRMLKHVLLANPYVRSALAAPPA